jgi:hypothetical protein
MPFYSYECVRERGGCGQEWKEFKSIAARRNVECPACLMHGDHKAKDPITGRSDHVIIIDVRNRQLISSIDHQDGRTGEPISMPAYGPDVTVTSRRQIKELREKTREKYFNDTDGEKTVVRPVQHKDGKVTLERFTRKHEGIDLGEIHTMEDPPSGRRRSALDPTKYEDDHIAELEEEVGPETPEEMAEAIEIEAKTRKAAK